MSTSCIQNQLLEITVVECAKLKDTEWISRQDPYVVLEYGSTKFRTRTCTDGGKTPVFQEKFLFTLIEGLREINVAVWNSNTIYTDDFIGNGKILLQNVLSRGFDDTCWPIHTKTGRFAGEVKLIMHYAKSNPSAVSYGSSAPPYVAPQIPTYSAPPPPASSCPYTNVACPPPYLPPTSTYPPTSMPPHYTSSYPSYPPKEAHASYPPKEAHASYPSYPPQQAYSSYPVYPPDPCQSVYPPPPAGYPTTTYPPPHSHVSPYGTTTTSGHYGVYPPPPY